MKAFIFPTFDHPDSGDGGIRRVVEAQLKYLPEYGIEIVRSPLEADVVNCHAGDLIQTDKPVVASCHGLYWTAENESWGGWAWELNKRVIQTIKRAQVTTAPSEWVAQSLRRGMLINPLVVYHGVDISEWEPLTEDRDTYVLWNKSRVDPICDPAPLNMLAQRFPSQRFVSTFGEWSANVQLVGKIPFSQMQGLIKRAGVYLATTLETFGVGTLEAMASGVPVLGFKFGGQSEIIKHLENGYLAEPGDYDDLSQGFEYCLQNAKRLGEAGRQTIVEHFQWHDIIKGYVDAYQQAVVPHTGPTISIVIPAYKLDAYLPACLDSILSQNFSDWEAIVVDDASPDRCGEIGEEYAARDPRIKVIHNKTNAYISEAKNIGIRAARGKYILPLDADDRLGDRTLEIFSRSFDLNPTLDIVTGSMEVYEDGKETYVSSWPSESPTFNNQIKGHNQLSYSSMYRKSMWERIGGYRRRYTTAEDAAFWAQMMSFGAVPDKVTNAVTLRYLVRPSSVSHSNYNKDYAAWFTWAKLPQITPYGASGQPPAGRASWPVRSYGLPLISVIIPVGPGHEIYLQDSVDSLVAQTLQEWELVIVNDTGKRWFSDKGCINPYITGFPFAKILDSAGPPKGPAAARNRGISASTAKLFALLDADDIAQPYMLEALYKGYKLAKGGWVYSDWLRDDGTIQEAESWSADKISRMMISVSSALYVKEDWKLVGGFDENAPGWEDWDFHLSLLEHDICGTRIKLPLMLYRYQTGTRREDNYEKRKDLIEYISKRHEKIYKDDRRFVMGCGCGKGGGKTDLVANLNDGSSANSMADVNGKVLVVYIGNNAGAQRIKSRVNPSISYVFGADDREKYVYEKDAFLFENNTQFNVLRVDPAETSALSIDPTVATLVADRDPVYVAPTLDLLRDVITPEVVGILKRAGYEEIDRVRRASPAELMSIKGIGAARAEKIMEAVNAYS